MTYSIIVSLQTKNTGQRWRRGSGNRMLLHLLYSLFRLRLSWVFYSPERNPPTLWVSSLPQTQCPVREHPGRGDPHPQAGGGSDVKARGQGTEELLETAQTRHQEQQSEHQVTLTFTASVKDNYAYFEYSEVIAVMECAKIKRHAVQWNENRTNSS